MCGLRQSDYNPDCEYPGLCSSLASNDQITKSESADILVSILELPQLDHQSAIMAYIGGIGVDESGGHGWHARPVLTGGKEFRLDLFGFL